MSMNVRIAGTGSYLPEKILTNHDLEQMVDNPMNEFVGELASVRDA